MQNVNAMEFGFTQSKQKVDDVILPGWTFGSRRHFVLLNMKALESDFVSQNLHEWINLIYGFKQRGKPAVDSLNVYYHLTYENNTPIDSIRDKQKRQAILDQIDEYGQTPR